MKKDFTKQDFYNMLRPNGDCLEWTGPVLQNGYGQTNAWGKARKAHRISLMLEGIDVSNGFVLHSCDNKLCCNPAHLRVGTHQDNMNDMKERHRQNSFRGTQCHNASITEQDVIEIRKQYADGVNQRQIARNMNTTPAVVFKVVHRLTWSHI